MPVSDRPSRQLMDVDWPAAVAAWLASRPRQLVPLLALGALLRDVPRQERRAAASAVLSAVDQLADARLIIVAHHFPSPVVGVLDLDGLHAIAKHPRPSERLNHP